MASRHYLAVMADNSRTKDSWINSSQKFEICCDQMLDECIEITSKVAWSRGLL